MVWPMSKFLKSEIKGHPLYDLIQASLLVPGAKKEEGGEMPGGFQSIFTKSISEKGEGGRRVCGFPFWVGMGLNPFSAFVWVCSVVD